MPQFPLSPISLWALSRGCAQEPGTGQGWHKGVGACCHHPARPPSVGSLQQWWLLWLPRKSYNHGKRNWSRVETSAGAGQVLGTKEGDRNREKPCALCPLPCPLCPLLCTLCPLLCTLSPMPSLLFSVPFVPSVPCPLPCST